MGDSFLITSSLLFLALFAFNFIGATSGGSALLVLPTCIFFGFTPTEAVATTRVGTVGSMVAGWYGFKNHGKVNHQIGVFGAIFASCGAVAGAYFMVSLSPMVLQRGLVIVMLIMLGLAILRKRKSKSIVLSPPSRLRKLVGYVSLSGLGFLTGLFGGLGVILNYILISAFRLPCIEAAGTRTIVNLFIAAVAVVVYYKAGVVNWHYVPIIFVAMTLGTYFGTLYGIKKGEKWVENILMIVTLLMAIKLLF